MRILSWNVQYGKSADGHLDFMRTLDHITALGRTHGEFDVICLQEIARYMVDYCRPDQEDHVQMAQQHFEQYSPIWGSGFSWPSPDRASDGDRRVRQEFGNLTLIKSGADLLDYKVHHLPQPTAPGKWQMPRVAIEACVASPLGPLSVINTHLAFHDSHETQLQLEHLTGLEQERLAQLAFPKSAGPGCFQRGCLPVARILCGDFNFEPESSHYAYQINSDWRDAWQQGDANAPYPPTCGIFDTRQWAQGEHCRDYFWLSREFATHTVAASIDCTTDLSDHQPIILEINT